MKKYDWKNEYNPIRRTAKRLLSGEALTDGRPLSDLIELDEHTRKCLAFEATLTDRQIDMLQELGYSKSTQLIGRELMTPDEVRMLDNRLSILLVRGEKPVIDEKYELMRHPNIHETEYGGAAPYVHHAACIYAVDDLPFAFETLNEIEVLELEESL